MRRERDRMLALWIDVLLATALPADQSGEAAKLLKASADPCANPMGSSIRTALGFLFDALLDGVDAEQVGPHLDRILDIQCAQQTRPGPALAFVFEFKRLFADQLGAGLRDPDMAEGYRQFAERVDQLALLAFDSYAKTQQKIADIRVREAQRSSAQLLAMTRLAKTAGSDCVPDPGTRG